MPNEYQSVEWGFETAAEADRLVTIAVQEDLDDADDWTSYLVTQSSPTCSASVVARSELVVAGLPILPLLFNGFEAELESTIHFSDGDTVPAGSPIVTLSGLAEDVLVIERTLLNFLGHLSGIATATSQYCEQVSGTSAKIYDTRKTLPGWRYLQKYAVRCGGGMNHRLGLHDGILLKDNHLALVANEFGVSFEDAPKQAILLARQSMESDQNLQPIITQVDAPNGIGQLQFSVPLEIEVDSLDQFRRVLPEQPDIILLDNMRPSEMAEAVAARDEVAPGVILEASGGITLASVRAVAESGVDRISVGALTHSVIAADMGLDWNPAADSQE